MSQAPTVAVVVGAARTLDTQFSAKQLREIAQQDRDKIKYLFSEKQASQACSEIEDPDDWQVASAKTGHIPAESDPSRASYADPVLIRLPNRAMGNGSVAFRARELFAQSALNFGDVMIIAGMKQA